MTKYWRASSGASWPNRKMSMMLACRMRLTARASSTKRLTRSSSAENCAFSSLMAMRFSMTGLHAPACKPLPMPPRPSTFSMRYSPTTYRPSSGRSPHGIAAGARTPAGPPPAARRGRGCRSGPQHRGRCGTATASSLIVPSLCDERAHQANPAEPGAWRSLSVKAGTGWPYEAGPSLTSSAVARAPAHPVARRGVGPRPAGSRHERSLRGRRPGTGRGWRCTGCMSGPARLASLPVPAAGAAMSPVIRVS